MQYRWELLHGERVVVLNANNTKKLSDKDVVGLIAHELAHLQLFVEKGITTEDVLFIVLILSLESKSTPKLERSIFGMP